MRNLKKTLTILTLCGIFSLPAFADELPVIGAVNFNSCMTESKLGKKEQEELQNLQKEMANRMENSDKEMKEIAAKFDDSEYLDSLSPKAEEEMKVKYQTLQEDMNRYQSQFYQIMQQAQHQIYQRLLSNISKASETLAKKKKLDYVMNKEACFYIRPDLDLTQEVIAMMDKSYEETKGKKLSDNGEDLDANQALEELMPNQTAG